MSLERLKAELELLLEEELAAVRREHPSADPDAIKISAALHVYWVLDRARRGMVA